MFRITSLRFALVCSIRQAGSANICLFIIYAHFLVRRFFFHWSNCRRLTRTKSQILVFGASRVERHSTKRVISLSLTPRSQREKPLSELWHSSPPPHTHTIQISITLTAHPRSQTWCWLLYQFMALFQVGSAHFRFCLSRSFCLLPNTFF
jgi:hypothetical protein